MNRSIFFISILILATLFACCDCDTSTVSGFSVTLKSADNGDGTYTNPIIQADYSDPDAIRVGNDFYMTASSFACAPGLPILHSTDLVTWQLIGYASTQVAPEEHYSLPQHGNGIWAPAIRYHNNEFYIYYGDPDFGVYMVKATNPAGPWSKPLLVRAAKGWIDTCPFWDEDGQAYLVHAYAGSRAGIKSILAITRMKPDGTALLDDGVLVFDGHADHPTVEGPKMYKRNGYYYIFAPAGGVKPGWQLVLRSKNIYGPYEERIVLHQGNTKVNGPHQGAWVDTQNGEDWFIHFQDQYAYGRVVHLQPMQWKDDWLTMGTCAIPTGEPVLTHVKPNLPKATPISPESMDDEFNTNSPSLLWQWHSNPGMDWAKSFPSKGVYRMYAQAYPEDYHNLWDVNSLFLQKFPALAFEATTKISLNLLNEGDRCGFLVMGQDYSGLEIKRDSGQLEIRQMTCLDARHQTSETYSDPIVLESSEVYLKITVKEDALCDFSFSTDNVKYTPLGETFKADAGRWIGAKLGYFVQKAEPINDSGWIDLDWFRYKLN